MAGLGMLAVSPVQADIYEDQVKAVTNLQEKFKQVETDLGIRVAPMLSAKSIQDLLDIGRKENTGTAPLDNEMRLRTYLLYRDGFNLVTMTCPSAGDNKYLPDGISIESIYTDVQLDIHYDNDKDTAPVYDPQGKRLNSLKREFSDVMHGGNFIPLDKTTIPDLKSKMFTETGPAKDYTTPLTSQQIDKMVTVYQNICTPRF